MQKKFVFLRDKWKKVGFSPRNFGEKINENIKNRLFRHSPTSFMHIGNLLVATYWANGLVSYKCAGAKLLFKMPKVSAAEYFWPPENSRKYQETPFFQSPWFFIAVYRAHLAWLVYQCYLLDEEQKLVHKIFCLKILCLFGWVLAKNLGKNGYFMFFPLLYWLRLANVLVGLSYSWTDSL